MAQNFLYSDCGIGYTSIMRLQCRPNWSLLSEYPKSCVCWWSPKKRIILVWSKWKIRPALHSRWSHYPVGKSTTWCSWETKNLGWFKITEGARPPLPYKNQANHLFDQKSLYGGFTIFWPYHLHTEGDANAILILDTFSAHTLSDE